MNTFRIKLISLLAYSGVVSASLFCAVACKHRVPTESSPEEIAQYVEACSAGEIKVTSTIQVLFKDTVASKDSAAAVSASRIMRFTPSLKGKSAWDSTARKLEFTPDKGQLKAGQTYYCRVHQGKLISGAKDIVFSFKVADRAAEMEVTEVRISSADPETAIVRGKVTLSEPVDDGIVTTDLFKTSTTWTTPATVTRIAVDSFEYEISGLRRWMMKETRRKLWLKSCKLL